MNFELIKDSLSAADLRRVEEEFEKLSEAEQLKIFLDVRKGIASEIGDAQWEIETHEDEIRSLEDDIQALEKRDKPIAKEIQEARIRLGLDPVPGQLSLLEVAS